MAVRGSLRRVGSSLLRMAVRSARSASFAAPPRRRPGARSDAYPGDFHGDVEPEYAPRADGQADPGEVVWARVPYEENHARGKDRPVLVVGHDGPLLLALMLTSKDHDRDAADEARCGRRWMDVGAGDWDRQRRPSEVRLDRVLRLDVDSVRREGCRLDRTMFDQVVQELARLRRDGDRRRP
jgi:hypothetical protein